MPKDTVGESDRRVSQSEVESAVVPQQESQPVLPTFAYSGLARTAIIPACFLSREDLRRLYRELSQKSDEALEHHLNGLKQRPDQTDDQFESVKALHREVG